jgi:hypothetical protein
VSTVADAREVRPGSSIRWHLGLIAVAALAFSFVVTFPVASWIVAVLAILAVPVLGLAALLRRVGWIRVPAYHLALVSAWAVGQAWLPGPAESWPALLAFAMVGLALILRAWVAEHRPEPPGRNPRRRRGSGSVESSKSDPRNSGSDRPLGKNSARNPEIV